jgi:hypothetical protein
LASKDHLGAPAEVPHESSTKRPRGRPTNVDHFRDEVGPENFLCVIFEWTLGMLPIPSKFIKWFGPIYGKIAVLTNTR